jgi:hypothetical protein
MRADCNPHFGGVRLILLIVVISSLFLGLLMVRHWSPKRVVARQQIALIAALERRSAKRLDHLLAPDYRDQWEFDREDVKLSILDIGSQFFVLTLLPVETTTTFGDGTADVQTRFEVTGNGSPLAHEIIRNANRLKTPFVFHWEKQSVWPGDWKLTRIENPDLVTELHGYQPGDLQRALENP